MVCWPHCAHWTDTSTRCRIPEVCAAVMAASLSFLACLHGLQRLGSFFSPLSWKNVCSPEVQTKYSLQSTHLMLRSGCSESDVVSSPCSSSRSNMIVSPRGLVMLISLWAGPLQVARCSKAEPPFPGEHRGERCAGLEQVERISQLITMAKLCQG